MANKKKTLTGAKKKTPTEAKITEFYEHRSAIVMKAIVAKGLRCNKRNSNGPVVKGFNKPTDAWTAYMHYGCIPAKNTPSFIQDIEPMTKNPSVFTSAKGETWSDNMTPVSIVTGDPIYQK